MKILMVNKYLYPKGGCETYVFDLSKYLIGKGHSVQFFGMEDDKNIVGNDMNLYVSNVDFKDITIKKIFYPCFLQVLFPESCKIFFHSIATGISTMLQTVFC